MQQSSQVLIVGAGPAGLMLALELAKHGVTPRVIDHASGPSENSRAILIQARSLEALGFSVASRIAELGQPLRTAKVVAKNKQVMELSLSSGVGLFEVPISISQPELEAILLDELASRGVEIQWGLSIVGLQQDDRVRAEFSDGSWSEHDYLVGADGAQSKVRELAGIPLASIGNTEHWIAADLRLKDDSLSPDQAVISVLDGRITALFPQGRTGLYRLVRTSISGAEQSADYWADSLREFGVYAAVEPIWSARFEVSEQSATKLQKGRVLLVGDAAHSHSPIGGQGMNLGILEANNLGWKLALVLAGNSPRILESYPQERGVYAAQAMAKAGAAFRSVKAKGGFWDMLRTLVLGAAGTLAPLSEYLTNAITRQSEHYPATGFNQEFFDSVQVADWDELPEPEDVDTFVASPGAGAQLEPRSEELWRIMDEPWFSVFVLDGRSTSKDGIARVNQALEVLNKVPQFRVYLISASPADFVATQVIADPELKLHGEFGTFTEAVFVVRPDGHIGFRSSPIDLAALQDWWEELVSGEFL